MGRRGGAVEKISITFGPYVACEPVKEVFLYPNQTTDTIMGDIKKMGLEFDLDEQVAQGNYSNLAIISHSTSEFIIDFAAVLPGVTKARVKSRVILTPEHAKRLLLSLQDNITRYESAMGKIEIPKPQQPENMGPKIGQA